MLLLNTERDIEANTDKCEAIIKMGAPTTKKEIMKLNGMLTTLNKFIWRLTQHALSLYKLLKNFFFFEWTLKDKHSFIFLRSTLLTPSVLSRPIADEVLLLYMIVCTKVFSVVII